MPLTDALCKNARTKPDQRIRKLSEGGLQLCIYPNGSKLWRIAYRYDGKPKTVSLGSYPEFSLADARLKREEIKKLLRSGQDPQSEKQAKKALVAATEPFQAWADRYAARRALEGRANATLKKQEWLLGMASKTLGNRPISEITAPEVLEVLRKVEAKGRLDTAVRLRATISTVFQ
ncbi:MAG: Arm DNA-binding domain-containing protein, partial [Rhizomicrobium sp.]